MSGENVSTDVVITSGEKDLKFLVSEEVFECYGIEVQLQEILETGKTDTEMVAYMGQFLLMRFMDQNEEIQSLRSVLSEQDQEMKYVKERQKYLNAIEANYQTATRDMEIETDELEKMNYGFQKELRRLQQDVVRSNETETFLRKSIFELAESRSVSAFQPETLKNFPTRDYCLLCLNPKDHGNIHNKMNDDLLVRLWMTQKRCGNLELEVETENCKKKILTEKLVALRKEVDALALYLEWYGREGDDQKSGDSGESIALPQIKTPERERREKGCSVTPCEDSVKRTERKMQECQMGGKDDELKPDESSKISDPTVLQISDPVSESVQKTQECWTGESDEELKTGEYVEMSELAQAEFSDNSDNDDDVFVHSMQVKLENDPQNEPEIETVEAKESLDIEQKRQEPETSKERVDGNNPQTCDDMDAHCSLCVVDGTCQACKAMQGKNFGCFSELFKIIISFVRAVLRDK